MSKRTPPFENYTRWTQAKFWTFIRSALRSAWSRYPVKYEAIKKGCVGTLLNPKTGRYAKMYQCTECLKIFVQKEIEVDHIVPIGSLRTYSDLPDFVRRMFCSEKELKLLCKDCHKKKTKLERANAKESI